MVKLHYAQVKETLWVVESKIGTGSTRRNRDAPFTVKAPRTHSTRYTAAEARKA